MKSLDEYFNQIGARLLVRLTGSDDEDRRFIAFAPGIYYNNDLDNRMVQAFGATIKEAINNYTRKLSGSPIIKWDGVSVAPRLSSGE